MDVGYATSAYDCQIEYVTFFLFRDQSSAEREIPSKPSPPWPRCYTPLQVDLRRFVNPAKVTDWPVLITPDHPGYQELRRSWFNTIGQRSRCPACLSANPNYVRTERCRELQRTVEAVRRHAALIALACPTPASPTAPAPGGSPPGPTWPPPPIDDTWLNSIL
jgi:hypothetical protein